MPPISISSYLDNVPIDLEIRQSLVQKMMMAITIAANKSFFSTPTLTKETQIISQHKLETVINNSIPTLSNTSEMHWENCTLDMSCAKSRLHAIAMAEIQSTAGILRFLTHSLLQLTDNPFFTLECDTTVDQLTGLWKNDSPHLSMKVSQSSSQNNTNGRLVMGFGPSAAGKTFCAKIIMSYLNIEPSRVFAIDGGLYRDLSMIYQLILAICNKHNILLDDLSYFIPALSIFNSDNIKNSILLFLKRHASSSNMKFNLYVPETLGGCSILKTTCRSTKAFLSKYYLPVTGDNNWIGLLIWQHKEKCPLHKNYKCIGCFNSGMQRQKKQGKKYNPYAYETSMKFGLAMTLQAPACFCIHNTGRSGNIGIIQKMIKSSSPSTIQDWSPPSDKNSKWLVVNTPTIDISDAYLKNLISKHNQMVVVNNPILSNNNNQL